MSARSSFKFTRCRTHASWTSSRKHRGLSSVNSIPHLHLIHTPPFDCRENSEVEQLKSLPFAKGQGALLAEFQTRIQQAEKKVEAMKRERDEARRSSSITALKKELSESQSSLAAKAQEADALRSEGEALSKKQCAMETTIKKLRAEAKTHETTIRTLQESQAAADETVKHQAQRIADLEQLERAARAATENAKRTESALAEALAAKRDTQAALDKACGECAELKKRLEDVGQESAAQVRSNMQKDLERANEEWGERVKALSGQVEELRTTVQKMSEDSVAKEEQNAQALAALRARAEAAESQNEELSGNALTATVPLLNQISSLEKGLADKDAECQKTANEARESVQALQTQLAQEKERVDGLRSELAACKEKMEKQSAVMESASAKAEALEKSVTELKQQLSEAEKNAVKYRASTERLESVVDEQKVLISQFEESSKKQEEAVSALQKHCEDVEKELSETRQARSNQSPSSSSPSMGYPSPLSMSTPANRNTFFGTATMEKFSEALAKKESDVAALQGQLTSLLSVKRLLLFLHILFIVHTCCCSGELEEEVLRLTSENATLQGHLNEKDSSREAVAALQKRNHAIMKQLEVANTRLEEMQLDADDMRQSYRLQLDQLAQENERLRHQQS